MGDFGKYEYSDIKSSDTKLVIAKEDRHNESTYGYSVGIILLLDDPIYAEECYWNLSEMFEAIAWKVHTNTKVNESDETISELTMIYLEKDQPIMLLISLENPDSPEYDGMKAITDYNLAIKNKKNKRIIQHRIAAIG